MVGKRGLIFPPSLLIRETHWVEGGILFPPGLQAVQANHGICRWAVRVAFCGSTGPGRLLNATEAAQVNYWHVFLRWETELAGGASPHDLHRPKVRRLTLNLVREKKGRETT